MRKSRREVTQKVVGPLAVEAAVPAAKRRVLPKGQATRLPPQLLLRRGYDLAKKLPTFTAAFGAELLESGSERNGSFLILAIQVRYFRSIRTFSLAGHTRSGL